MDEKYMRMAIELAKKGCGFVSPNPMVGAVIVKDNQIIGSGYHRKYGELHAERNAIASCADKELLKGATIYVTLEPCCHYGKTPPCTEAIIESGISKVIIGSRDINPLVAGKGVALLREAKIDVVENFLRDECDSINEVFFHFMRTHQPLVIMKYAMTMDGKIATVTGKSKWITGEKARENVHKDRHHYSGIMVGVQTVIDDNPLLTCRIPNGSNPARIICDSNLRILLDSQIVNTANQIPTYIATVCNDRDRQAPFIKKGCEIIVTPSRNNHVDLNKLIEILGKKNIDSVIIEGGGTLNYSALDARIVDKVQAYIAPKIFGGSTAKTPVQGAGILQPDEAIMLENSKITMLGDDILIESDVTYRKDVQK